MLVNKIKKIYVFEYAGRYKIGMTNDVQRRLNQLSCGCPGIKCIFSSDFMENASALERTLQKRYTRNSIGGEWFIFDGEGFIDEIEEIIRAEAKPADYNAIKQEALSHDGKKMEEIVSTLYSYVALENTRKETERIKEENKQLELFLRSVQGLDVENIYSDLIYQRLFDRSTATMREKFNPGRYESFKAYLTTEELQSVQSAEMLVSSLINCGWGYDQIKDFVMQNVPKQLTA